MSTAMCGLTKFNTVMKTLIKTSCLFLIMALAISCSEDDETSPIEAPKFTTIKLEKTVVFFENEDSHEITIPFATDAHSNGEFKIKLFTEDEINFETIPEMVNGEISFEVQEGENKVVLTILPEDNELVNGYQEYNFSISYLSENLRKLNEGSLIIGIQDDELKGMPKSMAKEYGDYTITTEYFYNSRKGLLKTISYFDDESYGYPEVQQYFYDGESRILKIKNGYLVNGNIDESNEIRFTWQDEKIVQTDVFYKDRRLSYTTYEYDIKDRVSVMENFYNEYDENSYLISYHGDYVYNQKDELVEISYINYGYANDWWPTDWQTFGVVTYDDYIEYTNPFPINEIIPGAIYQKNLRGNSKMVITNDGESETYEISYNYEFDSQGRLVKSTTIDETLIFKYL